MTGNVAPRGVGQGTTGFARGTPFVFERGDDYSSSTKKKEKVRVCYSRKRALPLFERRRYRMISPFLFSGEGFQTLIQRPHGR
jgi:hypothetical protein